MEKEWRRDIQYSCTVLRRDSVSCDFCFQLQAGRNVTRTVIVGPHLNIQDSARAIFSCKIKYSVDWRVFLKRLFRICSTMEFSVWRFLWRIYIYAFLINNFFFCERREKREIWLFCCCWRLRIESHVWYGCLYVSTTHSLIFNDVAEKWIYWR